MFGSSASRASTYRSLQLETSVSNAAPHELISMLFSGATSSIAQARHALGEGDVAAKGTATGKAVRIIEEGLKASLDLRAGELAHNLKSLYEYMAQRLLSANLNNDDAQYDEVATMLGQLEEAWNAIGEMADRRAVPA